MSSWTIGANCYPADYPTGFAEFGIGLSHLWEGQFRLAERSLRATLARYEHEMGRRSPIPCMMAAVLAAALWEMGGTREPRTLLASRLDVLERTGSPYAIILAYVTLAQLAMDSREESRAFEYLDAMIAIGESRNMLRLRIAGISEQIRLHALANRLETVERLCRGLEQICRHSEAANLAIFEPWVKLNTSRAFAYRSLVAREWATALQHLAVSAACADTMGMGRDSVEIRLLRAVALRHCDAAAANELFVESHSLASACGMARTLLNTHPDALETIKALSQAAESRGDESLPTTFPPESSPTHGEVGTTTGRQAANADALLTAKEHEVLDLISKHMSNKQIAVVLDISAGTVKWHVKNIFTKLNAGHRAHAVKRAQLLGIVETGAR
jgi:LuxR family maltose regulon positive regulatory protein